jgi:hypothetical protein
MEGLKRNKSTAIIVPQYKNMLHRCHGGAKSETQENL